MNTSLNTTKTPSPMTTNTQDSTRPRRCVVAATIAAAMLVSTSANAIIVGQSSGGVHGPYTMGPGTDLRLGNTEDNTRSWVFLEQQNVGLPSNLV
ncbi:MAG: hypothetical protein ACOYN0_03760, partial [Phycisphaerales bacterium]